MFTIGASQEETTKWLGEHCMCDEVTVVSEHFDDENKIPEPEYTKRIWRTSEINRIENEPSECCVGFHEPMCQCHKGGPRMVQALRVKKTEKKEVTPLIHPAGLEVDREGQTPILRRHPEGQLSLWWPDGTVELYMPASVEDWEGVKANRVTLE